MTPDPEAVAWLERHYDADMQPDDSYNELSPPMPYTADLTPFRVVESGGQYLQPMFAFKDDDDHPAEPNDEWYCCVWHDSHNMKAPPEELVKSIEEKTFAILRDREAPHLPRGYYPAPV